MTPPAPLLTVVLEAERGLDKESTTYRRLIGARLKYDDHFSIEVSDEPLTAARIQAICAKLESTYVVFMRSVHQVSPTYLTTLLDYLRTRTIYLAEPMIYTGTIPRNPSDTKLDADYFYARDTDPFGVAFNRRRLMDFLDAVPDLSLHSIYLGYRLYWSIGRVKPLSVGYSVASDTKGAIGTKFGKKITRLVPLLATTSPEMRWYLLRLLAHYLRGVRRTTVTSVTLTHLQDLIRINSLVDLVDRVAINQPFEAAWIRWLADPSADRQLYKQLSNEDAYLTFRAGETLPPDDILLYNIAFAEDAVTVCKSYQPRSIRRGYARPATYDFYRRPITPQSTMVFFDRPMSADDNAEHLYEYFMRKHPDFTKILFALNPKSPDWDRLSKKGFRLIHMFSPEFYEAFLISDVVVSSQIYNLRYKGKSLTNSRFVYLQHGVQLNDMTDWVVSKHFDVFVATGKLEADYLSAVAPRETLNSGLPRMESLHRRPDPKRPLVFMPTWRFGLHQASPEHFLRSEYYRNIEALLTDRRLLEFLEVTDRELHVKLHPNVEKRATAFRFTGRVVRTEKSYQDAIATADIVFTDFSSVVTDAAFIGVPIAYWQWDASDFFREQPYDSRLDYRTEGMGPVFEARRDLVEHLVSEEYTTTPQEYAPRRARFFEGVDPTRINATIAERILSL